MYNVVSCGAFKISTSSERSGGQILSGCGLLDALVEGWILCKGGPFVQALVSKASVIIGLKEEVDMEKLLSAASLEKYLKNLNHNEVNEVCEHNAGKA